MVTNKGCQFLSNMLTALVLLLYYFHDNNQGSIGTVAMAIAIAQTCLTALLPFLKKNASNFLETNRKHEFTCFHIQD